MTIGAASSHALTHRKGWKFIRSNKGSVTRGIWRESSTALGKDNNWKRTMYYTLLNSFEGFTEETHSKPSRWTVVSWSIGRMQPCSAGRKKIMVPSNSALCKIETYVCPVSISLGTTPSGRRIAHDHSNFYTNAKNMGN